MNTDRTLTHIELIKSFIFNLILTKYFAINVLVHLQLYVVPTFLLHPRIAGLYDGKHMLMVHQMSIIGGIVFLNVFILA